MSKEEEKKNNKATKVEKEQRIFTIQGWILDGVQDYLILKQSKTQWNIGTRQARKYIREAYERWKQQEDISMELRRNSKLAELQKLKRSLKPEFKGTPSGIRAIMSVEKEIIRLEPYSIKRVDLTSGGLPIQDMTPEERKRRIEELKKKI